MGIGVNLLPGVTLATGITTTYAALIYDEKFKIEFDLTCSGGPSTVNYYLEYSDDLINWYQEVDEIDAGKGVVSMAKVLRTLADNGSTTIADNAHFRASVDFIRRGPFVRLQIAASAGTVVVNSIQAPFDKGPYGALVIGTGTPTPPCNPDHECFSMTFGNGPYTAPAPGGSPVLTLVDIDLINLECFGAGPYWWSGSITFKSPANWTVPQQGSAAIYLGGDVLAIGATQPPSTIGGAGSGNILIDDPGPANATTTVSFGPILLSFVPTANTPAKLVIRGTSVWTTTVVSAQFDVCDHEPCTTGQPVQTIDRSSSGDTASNPPSAAEQFIIAFPMSSICTNLFFQIDPSSSMEYDVGGSVRIVASTSPTGTSGTTVWLSSLSPTGGGFAPVGPNEVSGNFTNPNPGGTSYIKVLATPGTGTDAGLGGWIGAVTVQ